MNKTTLTKAFKALEKYGFMVLTFQDNQEKRKGEKGMTDQLIIGQRFFGDIYFIEIKTLSTKDKLSEKQRKIKDKLTRSSNYFIVNEDNYKDIIQKILEGIKK